MFELMYNCYYYNMNIQFNSFFFFKAPSKKRSARKKADSGEEDEDVYVPKKQRFMEKLYKEKEEALKTKEAKRFQSVINVWGQG